MTGLLSLTLSDPAHPLRALVCELCRQFYTLGWVSGTGGGIAIREGGHVLVAPSGVQKERLAPEDLFVLDMDANVVAAPASPALKVSECQPLFWEAFRQRNAGAVLHSHSLHAMLATRLFGREFRISNLEMIKGLRGYGAFDTVRIPIIENTARECDLAESMSQAIADNPQCDAVLVRGHGIYVWGESWMRAKTQAECLDYLFQAAVEMTKLGLLVPESRDGASESDPPRRRIALAPTE